MGTDEMLCAQELRIRGALKKGTSLHSALKTAQVFRKEGLRTEGLLRERGCGVHLARRRASQRCCGKLSQGLSMGTFQAFPAVEFLGA